MRQFMNRCFSAVAWGSFLVVAVSLVVILGPMLWRGSSAVFFRGTVEFRRVELELFKRGDRSRIEAEIAEAARARAPIYELLDHFKHGIDIQGQVDEARSLHREFSRSLRQSEIRSAEASSLRDLSQQLRDKLCEALESTDKPAAQALLAEVLAHRDDSGLKDSPMAGIFRLAEDYQKTLNSFDMNRREEYAQALSEVQATLTQLLGPRPGQPAPALLMEQYGATRWDQAQKQLAKLLYAEKWVSSGPGQPLQRERVPREEQFKGTELAGLFPMVRDNLEAMLRPRPTFYWRYFTDDNFSSHFFGGVGPEILGTLLMTVISILFAVPLGIVAAAYLIECAGDNALIMFIRTCINTLAGVPSIVFGLFGLAFFVLFLLPRLGLSSGSSILAGSLTLAVLILPVIIRASEEAIRSVPRAYKEASHGPWRGPVPDVCESDNACGDAGDPDRSHPGA